MADPDSDGALGALVSAVTATGQVSSAGEVVIVAAIGVADTALRIGFNITAIGPGLPGGVDTDLLRGWATDTNPSL